MVLLLVLFTWCDRGFVEGRNLVKGRPPSLCLTRAARVLKVHGGLNFSSKAAAGALLLGGAARSRPRGLAVRCILCGLPISRGRRLLGLWQGFRGGFCWPALGQAVKVCGPGIAFLTLQQQLLDMSVLLANQSAQTPGEVGMMHLRPVCHSPGPGCHSCCQSKHRLDQTAEGTRSGVLVLIVLWQLMHAL